MNGINLIPPAILVLRRRRRRIRLWSVATAGYSLALAGAYGAFASGRADAIDARQRIAELAAQVERERADLVVIRDRAVEAHREADAARMMASHPDWSVLLALLASPLTPDMTIDSCELTRVEPAPPPAAPTTPAGPAPRAPGPTADVYRVILTGMARTQSQVTSYALDLERLGADEARLFDTVTLVEAKGRRIGSTDIVAFRIECGLVARPPGPARGGAQ
ncbi:MAG: hypothetical protein IT436_18355 [Phycisphaerales bacterium]|nr:hypothetical protein [Phycisphaerales bacterium]